MGRLIKGDGTALTRTALNAALTTDPTPEQTYTVPASLGNIYEERVYPDVRNGYASQEQRLLYKVGDRLTATERDALFAQATVTAVSPTTAGTAGGSTHTLTGTHFEPGTTVTVGGTAATNVKVVSNTSLTFTAPAKSAGAQAVVATTGYGTSTGSVSITYS